MPSLYSNRGAKRAREARAALTDDPAAPLECVLAVAEEAMETPVIVAELPEAIAGACCRSASGAVVWVNGAHGLPRRRFTLAHELGHLWIGHEVGVEVDDIQTLKGTTTNPLEIEANAFAAAFLVPAAGLRERVNGSPSLDDVVILAADYGVSAIMLTYRLKQLELASPQRIRRLEEEIAEDLHRQAYERLEPPTPEDGLSRINELPYLSPALNGSLLDAALKGDAAVDRSTGAAIDRLMR
jgi:Zn-dependent peptidase ImmA (M78 family)